MTTNDSIIQIRIDEKTKSNAQKTLAKLGLDLSSATKIFLKKVINTKSIPFDIKTENGYTYEEETRLLRDLNSKGGYSRKFKSASEMFDDLDKQIDGKKKNRK